MTLRAIRLAIAKGLLWLVFPAIESMERDPAWRARLHDVVRYYWMPRHTQATMDRPLLFSLMGRLIRGGEN